MVLLKNDGILPLINAPKNIVVVGPLADNKRVLEGNYNGTPSRSTTALEGIKKQFVSSNVSFVPGTHFLREPKVVPAAFLTTPEGQPGLKAEYFKNKEAFGDSGGHACRSQHRLQFYRLADSRIFQWSFLD